MGGRGASAKGLGDKDMTKTAASSDLLETVPSLIPREIRALKNPSEFGAAYAKYYRTARGGEDTGRLAAAAVSTWIAKNGYKSDSTTTENENSVNRAAREAVRK